MRFLKDKRYKGGVLPHCGKISVPQLRLRLYVVLMFTWVSLGSLVCLLSWTGNAKLP